MTSGIGLRWAFTGPIMTNVLGGGGNFRHMVEHLGPASKVWTDDMHKHEFDSSDPKSVNELSNNVEEWVSNIDLETLEKKRDRSMLGLVQEKSKDAA